MASGISLRSVALLLFINIAFLLLEMSIIQTERTLRTEIDPDTADPNALTWLDRNGAEDDDGTKDNNKDISNIRVNKDERMEEFLAFQASHNQSYGNLSSLYQLDSANRYRQHYPKGSFGQESPSPIPDSDFDELSAMGALSGLAKDDFGWRLRQIQLRTGIRQKNTCVSHCSLKRVITVHLSKNLKCDSFDQKKLSKGNNSIKKVPQPSSLKCHFRKYSTHQNDPVILDEVTQATCTNSTVISCPTYYDTDCNGFSWIERSARIDLGQKVIYYHYYDVVADETRPFLIRSILQDPREDIVLVVSYYLPNMLRPNNCNQLYCVYQHPSEKRKNVQKNDVGTTLESDGGSGNPVKQAILKRSREVEQDEDNDAEIYPAIVGDVSFAYCPKPDRVTNATTLRLVYNPLIFSAPFPFKVEPRDQKLGNTFMTICAIVRKEGFNLVEWIEFHIMMGYRRFILYDNNPQGEPDDIMEKVIRSYPYLIVRRYWPHLHSQTEAYTDCINRYGHLTKWMTLIDVDEYLVPSMEFPTVRLVLRDKFSKTTYIHTHWVTFGPCGERRRKAGELTAELCTNVTKSSSPFPKSTFQPAYVAGMQNFGPHYVRLKRDLGKIPVSHAVDAKNLLKTYHYRYRTKAEFLERRRGPRAGRALNWSDSKLQHEWKKGMHNSKILPPSKNNILRFISTLRKNVLARLKRAKIVV